MYNDRKESEQSGHDPIKNASLECIWSEWKNEINEKTVSFQTKIQSREANHMDWLWVIWLLKLSEAEWDEMTYKCDEMEKTKEMEVLYLTLQLQHVYGEIKRNHKTYSAWPTFHSSIFQVQVMLPESTCSVLTCYYYRFLTRNFNENMHFIFFAYINTEVGPCHHDMVRPQVADGGTAPDKEGSCEYIE